MRTLAMVALAVMLAATGACLGDLEPAPGGNNGRPDAAPPNNPPPDGGGNNTLSAKEIFEAECNGPLGTKCANCHGAAFDPKFAPSDATKRYDTLKATTAVLGGFDPTKATLIKYQHAATGPGPKGELWSAAEVASWTKWMEAEAKAP